MNKAERTTLAAVLADYFALGGDLQQAHRLKKLVDADQRGTSSTKTPVKRQTHKPDPPELREAKKAVRARSGGYCEARLPGCTGQAEHAHHRKMRSQGGSHRTVNLLDVCLSCHDHIHLVDVAGAYERGHLLHSWENEGPLP